MSCDPTRVTGYVDGVLPETERLELQGHLTSCAACPDQVAFEQELRGRLKGLATPEPRAGFEEDVRRRLRRARAKRLPWTLPLAASLAFLVLWGRGAAPFVAWELARDHAHCFGFPKLPAEVWSGDPAQVSAWLESRGARLPLIPASAGGLELIGARFCPLVDRSVAHVYYVAEDRRLSLYVVPGTVRHGGSYATTRDSRVVRLLRVGGVNVGLVGERDEDAAAFSRAFATSVAGNLPVDSLVRR